MLPRMLPGLAQTVFVAPVASAVGTVAGSLDVATAVVPGAGWPGGYLALALLLALAAAAAASSLEARPLPGREPALAGGAPATIAPALRTPGRTAVPRLVSRSARVLAAADGWLAEQPGLALVVAGAIACLFIFR